MAQMAWRTTILLLVLCQFAVRAGAASLDVQVRDAAGKPVREAIVYAMPSSGPQETQGKTAVVEQIDREYVPYVSAIQTGTSVTFPNRDSILHHVYSFSPAKSFEIKLYTGKSPTDIVFDKPGVVSLGCNIHDWMIAYILVVSTPHFGRTGEDGAVRLKDLPAGSYEVRAWHPQQREPGSPHLFTLGATTESRAALALDVAPRKSKYKPPLDRLKY